MGEDNRGPGRAKTKALRRNQALWDHYRAHGILLLDDFKRITGGQYRSVLATFDTYGLQSPPVYDSRSERYKRRAKLLRDEADRLNQDHLTISHAAKVLNVKPNKIIGVEAKLLRAGCQLPDIIADKDKPVSPYQESRDYTDIAGKINGNCNSLYYPTGLQVAKYWPGPGENEVTYLIR